MKPSVWRAVGPGILFAGAAVGVSHLVQSTRTGAVFGLSVLAVGVVLGANFFKYAAFRLGPHYTAATGLSLLEGYRRQGTWALWLYAGVSVATMFTVQAAVTLVTAALARTVLGWNLSVWWLAAGLTLMCAAVLATGRYHWLDAIAKLIVAVFTVATLVATVLLWPRLDASLVSWTGGQDAWSRPSLFFLAAVVGWMPSALDISVWQSLWMQAKKRDTGRDVSMAGASIDFHVGYLGTVVLALCFVVLGAGVMHAEGLAFADAPAAFAAQLVDLYASTLGQWTRPLMGVAALGVMFSTTLTVVDGFPRALSVLLARFRRAEDPGADEGAGPSYWGAMAVMAVGSLGFIGLFLGSLKAMVDLATTLSFLTAPVLALLNHRAATSADVPASRRPAPWLVKLSGLSILVLGALAAGWLWLRFT